MQIRHIDGLVARCEAKGMERDINLMMLQHEQLEVDDYIVAHLGQAIQKISPDEARIAWELYDQMLAG